jgi:hypothetical protein
MREVQPRGSIVDRVSGAITSVSSVVGGSAGDRSFVRRAEPVKQT